MEWFIFILIVIAYLIMFLVSPDHSDSVLSESRSTLVNSGVSEELLSSFDEGIKKDGLPFNKKESNIRYLTVYYLILQKAICLAEPHIQELFRHRRAGVTIERYGVINTQAWDSEYKYFYENIIEPYMRGYLLSLRYRITVPFFKVHNKIGPDDNSYDFYHEDLFTQLKKRIELSYLDTEDELGPQDLDYIEDGFEYEKELANFINETCDGWSAYSTSGSGDQGVDVVATHTSSEATVAIQAKLYTGNVGNKAVQEINAGQQHFNYDFGAVVTNSKYTISAYSLAESLNIKLLHHSQLQGYLEELGTSEALA